MNQDIPVINKTVIEKKRFYLPYNPASNQSHYWSDPFNGKNFCTDAFAKGKV
jgi:hypothetical protein